MEGTSSPVMAVAFVVRRRCHNELDCPVLSTGDMPGEAGNEGDVTDSWGLGAASDREKSGLEAVWPRWTSFWMEILEDRLCIW